MFQLNTPIYYKGEDGKPRFSHWRWFIPGECDLCGETNQWEYIDNQITCIHEHTNPGISTLINGEE